MDEHAPPDEGDGDVTPLSHPSDDSTSPDDAVSSHDSAPSDDPFAPPEYQPATHGDWMRNFGLGVARTVAALVSVAVLGTMGYGWWAFGDVDEHTVTTDVIAPEVADEKVPLDGAVDMLLVGLDSRTDAHGNPLPREVLDELHAGFADGERNTDTMMLVHIPVDGTRAVAISFPRDAWVDIAGGFGKHKLNSAFAYAYNDARQQAAREGVKDAKQLDAQAAVAGRKNLIATIEQLIGKAVTIDRYAEVNLASFYEVTKAIGGVEVCLNEAVDDPRSGANFPKGRQTIFGAEALAFVRQRYGLPNGDLDRIVRQQAFLGALADKVLSAEMLTSPLKARELIGAVQRSVVLSKGWELSKFAAQMQGLSSGAIDFYTIPTLGGAKIGGADVLKVDPAAVHAFVASLTTDGSARTGPTSEPPVPDATTTVPAPTTTGATTPFQPIDTAPPAQLPATAITVDIRNGSETTGLATTVQERLAQKGFRRGEIGDAPVQGTSVINYASGEQYSAQLVANELGGNFALEPDLSLPAGRVRVLLGTDYPVEAGAGLAGRHALDLAPASSGLAPPPPQVVAGGRTCVN